VPRQNSRDENAPRRRRRASAVAIEADAERGFLMRVLLHSPKDTVAGALAFAAVSAIVANALLLQAGRHPAPLFGTVVTMPAEVSIPASPLPRPRPVEALSEPKPAEPKAADSRSADPLANLVKATSAMPVTPSAIPRPPASIPVSTNSDAVSGAASRRVAAVQRALTEYGYGQLKPTGTVGSDTQAAIQKFERAHKIPVTGQMSDHLVRELTASIGHPID